MLSVIVPTCNRPEDLRVCLQHLSPAVQSLPAELYEVIVTDDGRRLPAQQWCGDEFPWVVFVVGPAKGPAANRNHGANCAQYDWLVFIDDDCIAEPDLLSLYSERSSRHINRELVLYIGATERSIAPPSLLWEAPHNPSGENGISANFLLPQYAFDAVGRFDERFPSAAIEDTEFFARFQLLGGLCKALPNAKVIHPLRRIGGPRALAMKWEGKVIWALDCGAPARVVVYRLPWHVFRVILSRFRNKNLSSENIIAAGVFALELFWVITSMMSWVHNWSRRPRSEFWREHTKLAGPPPRYGF